jgi:hypothetical protein
MLKAILKKYQRKEMNLLFHLTLALSRIGSWLLSGLPGGFFGLPQGRGLMVGGGADSSVKN